MSNYSSNFPTQRPSLNLVFNGGSDQLDSRISYTRSSTGTYMSSERHLSSDNILTYSSTFDNASWVPAGTNGNPSSGQTDPSGGTNGYTVAENSDNNWHRLVKSVSGVSNSYALVLYAKQNTGTRYLTLSLVAGNNDYEAATFDLAGGSPVLASGSSSAFTSVSATQTASGNGYYKCVLKATGNPVDVRVNVVNTTSPSLSSFGSLQYTGDGTSSIDVAFASLSSTGATDYNATTTQIHREFAPLLKTAAANAPRFEYAADGQSVGTPKGLLVESQASNLYPNSSDMTGNSGALCNVDSNVAVGPAGDLTADALRLDDTDANSHYRQYHFTAAASTAYTFSAYVKASGLNYIAVRATANFSSAYTFFNVSSGTVEGSPSMPSTIESVGNGWFRCSVTATSASATTSSFRIYITDSPSSTVVATGDSYRSVVGTGIQIEAASAPSSLISTSGATASRAADSCSVATSSFYTGGPVSVVSEFSGGAGYYPEVWELRDTVSKAAGVNNYYLQIKYSAAADSSVNWRSWANESDNLSQVTLSASSSATKLGFSVDTNSVASCADGGTIHNMTSTVIPDSLDTLYIGRAYASTSALNGHIQRLALYNVALSDTELQALTS